MAVNVFSVPVFLVVFRESLETGIIVSVLLAFLKQTLGGPGRDVTVYKALPTQVWMGTALGLTLCVVVAAAIIGVFYGVGRDSWQAHEYYYEGSFALFASIIITLMQRQRPQLSACFKRNQEKYVMFFLPLITILREGIEMIVFIFGVTFAAPATAVPLPVVVGLIVGVFASYLLYK
ncbi:plasma membrane iron permease [Colletotrichum salicis]|uniref:Plasma membrane iron permease n=1 Tax=Colletotrichum salicis TaxID=1209931 RepID=A0A135V4C3_9PEZI|nr:plasma membrane iron permease [Colletotrichum salicis]